MATTFLTAFDAHGRRYYKSQFDFKKQKRPKPAGEIHLGEERALVKSHSDVDYE